MANMNQVLDSSINKIAYELFVQEMYFYDTINLFLRHNQFISTMKQRLLQFNSRYRIEIPLDSSLTYLRVFRTKSLTIHFIISCPLFVFHSFYFVSLSLIHTSYNIDSSCRHAMVLSSLPSLYSYGYHV